VVLSYFCNKMCTNIGYGKFSFINKWVYLFDIWNQSIELLVHQNEIHLSSIIENVLYVTFYLHHQRNVFTWKVKTLKGIWRALFDLQWLGKGEQRIQGDPVGTSSPGSPRNSCIHCSWGIISSAIVEKPDLIWKCYILVFSKFVWGSITEHRFSYQKYK